MPHGWARSSVYAMVPKSKTGIMIRSKMPMDLYLLIPMGLLLILLPMMILMVHTISLKSSIDSLKGISVLMTLGSIYWNAFAIIVAFFGGVAWMYPVKSGGIPI